MDNGNAKEAPATTHRTANRSWQATVLTQAFALLWIVPILVLLIFNLHGYTIGASAWCPSGACYPQLFDIDTKHTQELLKKYNDESHNLLGALQFVAKALEVWFEVIASFIVYLVAMEIASKEQGLCVGYIMIPFEFSRIPFVFDFLLYRIAPSWCGAKTKGQRAYRRRIYLLLLLAFFLCAICNLMGPATAVLVLPTLQFLDTDKIGNTTFAVMNAASPPAEAGWFQQYSACTAEDANVHNYSCSQGTLGDTFDSWLASSEAIGFTGSTQQDSISFGINDTYQVTSHSDNVRNAVYWSPNRQVLSQLSDDLNVVALISGGMNASTVAGYTYMTQDKVNTYTEYNRSLEVYMQRSGPILGAIPGSWYSDENATYWTVSVEADRRLRCYSHYLLGELTEDNARNYTKCISIGTGWSSLNKAENFSIAGSYNYSSDSLSPATDVRIYSSDQAFYLANGTLPSWMPEACFNNGTVPTGTQCDWARLARENELDSSALNRSRTNVNTVELQNQDGSLIVMDFVAHLSFATYTLDCSPLSNPYWNIQTQGIADSNSSIPIDPAWILAAWSADSGGILYPNRISTLMATEVVHRGGNSDNMVFLTILTAAQTLSLIDFTTQPSMDAEAQHFLYRNARINVYAYQISSRTAILGVIVAVVGVVVVLLEFILAMVLRRPFRSSTQILISALSHTPREEFDEKSDEAQEGKVRFHIQDTSRERLSFRHIHF